jgi:signal transduction histidine kinase
MIGCNIQDMKDWHSTIILGLCLTGAFGLALVWVFIVQPTFWSASDTVEISKVGQALVIVAISAATLLVYRLVSSSGAGQNIPTEQQTRVSPDLTVKGEEALIEALDTIPEGFVIYDSNDKLVRCNARFREIYGYSEQEAQPGVTQHQLGLLDEQRGVQIFGGSGESFLKQRLDYRSRLKGDQEIRLPDGRLITTRERRLARGGFVSIQADITELKETQERLRKSEQLLLDAIESLDEGFVFFDEEDRLVVANSTYKRMYPAQKHITPGIRFEDAVRLSVEAGEVPAAIGQEEEWLATRFAQHRKLSGGSEQVLMDGNWVKVSERRTVDGGIVGIRTDITELKDSHAQAEAANRAKTSFLAHMSHELRTPLNSIIGYSDMVRHETFGPLGEPKYAEYVENIYSSGAFLLSLINDILDISRVEIGELESFPERVDPKTVIASVVEMMKPRADEKELKLTVRAATYDAGLYVDKRHLQQMLINLIGNSIKFTAKGEDISVQLSGREDEGVDIVVTDEGCGIAENEIRTIFDPFSQVGDAFGKANEGTGLGLYLVKSLAELNEAKVQLDSELGVGTSVKITFPEGRAVR